LLLTELFGIPNGMTLADVTPIRSYRILALAVTEESVMATRLRQLGFVPGMKFVCEAVAPLIRNPYLVRIRGINVALSRHEALLINIEEIHS
jgi:Fe2+ transport system protein FeoA